jgi:hypothetical protein
VRRSGWPECRLKPLHDPHGPNRESGGIHLGLSLDRSIFRKPGCPIAYGVLLDAKWEAEPLCGPYAIISSQKVLNTRSFVGADSPNTIVLAALYDFPTPAVLCR